MRRKQPAVPARSTGGPPLPLLLSAAVALVVLAGVACRDHGAAPRDASGDGPGPETTSPLTLDIAVTGCAHYEIDGTCDPDGGTGPCCTGAPPLSLSFAAVGSPGLTTFRWDFGDGSPGTTERAPSHAYAGRGLYRVTLVGGAPDTGTVAPPQPLTVVVEPLAIGGFCDVAAQCDDGLTCLCAPGSGCPSAFLRGLCSSACDAAPCPAGSVCAALSSLPASGAAPATPVCLAVCQPNGDCGPGSVCETLPASPATAATPWTRACLPLGALVDVGGPCRDPSEALDDQACTTNLCADVGALGVCSAACDDSHLCPPQAACVLLTDAKQLCLATCTVNDDCARDPLLTCAATRRAGGGAGNVLVCAPKVCSADAVCAPSGRCDPDHGICIRSVK